MPETPSPLRRSFTSDIRSARTIASIFFNGVEYYMLSHLKMGFDLSLGPSLDVSFRSCSFYDITDATCICLLTSFEK